MGKEAILLVENFGRAPSTVSQFVRDALATLGPLRGQEYLPQLIRRLGFVELERVGDQEICEKGYWESLARAWAFESKKTPEGEKGPRRQSGASDKICLLYVVAPVVYEAHWFEQHIKEKALASRVWRLGERIVLLQTDGALKPQVRAEMRECFEKEARLESLEISRLRVYGKIDLPEEELLEGWDFLEMM